MSSQILELYDDSLTSLLVTTATNVQDVRPRAEQRGVNIDGGRRESAGPALALEGNSAENGDCKAPHEPCIGIPLEGDECIGGMGGGGPGMLRWNGNNRICGDIRLDTGTYSPTDIDLAMPAPGFSWVIGRTYNARQEVSSAHHDSDGYMGRNWFQLFQPEILLFDHATDAAKDVLYLIYGADRYIEFKREGASSNQFKAKNGAAGAFDFTAASGGEPERYTYTDQHGTQAVFFGFDNDAGVAKGQFWKITDPAGNVAYVGHETTITGGSGAITLGYHSNGGIKLAFDSAGRRYTSTYTTLDSTDRLTQVKVEIDDGGWVEVNRVDYAYYESSDTAYGEAGNLKLVTVTTPLSDSTKSLIRKKHYRYWKSGDTNGTSYQVKLVVDYEGTRNQDYQDSTFNDSFLSASHNSLIDYAAAYFEYSSRKISTATFNGQRACSGFATGVGTYDFTYDENGSHPGGTAFDEEWKYRTKVELPDTTYLVQLFDEVGQPLGQGRFKVSPSGPQTGQESWLTEVIRDSSGRITSIHSPANVTAYTHSTGLFTTSTSAGLVTVVERQSSGDLTGFITDLKHQTGTSGSEFLDRTLTYTTATKTIGDATVVRPLIASRRIYEAEITSGTTDSHVTSLTYTSFYTGDGVLMPKEVKTDYPAVSASKNGSAAANSAKQYFNDDGTLAFQKLADDRVDYFEYSGGQLSKRIDDADTSRTGTGEDFENVTVPTGFETVGSGAFHRRTFYVYDRQGRLDQTSSTATGIVKKRYYSMLKNRLQVTLAYNDFDESATPDKFYGPVQYIIRNHAGRVVYQSAIALSNNESTATITTHVDTTLDSVIDAVANLGTAHLLSKSVYNETGARVEEERQYHTTVAPSGGGPTGEGSDGTNFDTTSHAYDAMGRRIRTKEAHGTIRRTAYDELGRVIAQEIGTNDNGDPEGEPSGTNDMVTVSETEYDSGSDRGNSRVTKRTLHLDDSGTNTRVTTFKHDVRGRVLLQTNPAEPKHVLNKYDNLSRVTATAMYSTGDGSNDVDETDDPITRSEDRLSLNRTYYDELGRTYKTTRHKIDLADGSDDDNLESLTWYDKVGRTAKQQGEQLVKFGHNRLGAQTHQFILATTNDASYSDALNVTGDIVLEEHQSVYDAAGGNVLMTATIARTHDDFSTGETTGPLDTNADGDPLLYTASDIKGRIQITAMWYDHLDRLTDVVQYGTNSASGNAGTFDRDPDAGLSPPARADDKLRTTYTYDTLGRQDTVEDPKGIKTKFTYDEAGRQTKIIRNYDAGVNGGNPSGTDDNQTVEYVYTDGLRTKVIARMPSALDDQETIYTYGTAKGTNPDSKIATGHLLQKVQYPDSSGGTDVVTFAYNAQGQPIYKKDQAGNVFEFDFDAAGRQTQHRVTTLATGFDGAIRRIATSHDLLGRASRVSSYDNATVGSGTVQNEVKYTYEGWGLVSMYEQDHNGAVVDSGDQYIVSYAYEKKGTGNGRYTIRRTTMTLPNGDDLSYVYASVGDLHDDDASRVTRVAEGSGGGATNRVRYWYLGAGQLVGTVYNQPDPDVTSNLFDSNDDYDALDRFNRVTISRWKQSTTDLYNVALTYDRNSNVVTSDDSVQTGFDWKYTYDDLDRLLRAQAGTLSGGSITSETRDQNWVLDHAGNWTNVTYDLSADDVYTGTDEYDWDFTHNKANEITGWDNQSDNVAPTYDAAGNLTDDKRHWKYEYDAFYRLAKVRDLANDVKAEFKYNGLGHRITSRYDETAPWYHYAYDERWREVALYEGSDADPLEQFWPHNAGESGHGHASYIDNYILRERDTDSSGTLDERLYYYQNWHHDVSAVAATDGFVTERYNYAAYGSATSAFLSVTPGKAYAGYEYDAVLGDTYHVRHRIYRSDLGIWTRRDPIDSGASSSEYGVLPIGPIRGTDPLGLYQIVVLPSLIAIRRPCPNVSALVQISGLILVLPGEPPAKGLWVQKVSWRRGETPCNGFVSYGESDTFWEAPLGEVQTINPPAFLPFLDNSQIASHAPPSVGWGSSSAEVRFITEKELANGAPGEHPANWAQGGNGRGPNRSLWTRERPSWWRDNDPNASSNTHFTQWDCCCFFTNNVTTTVSPDVQLFSLRRGTLEIIRGPALGNTVTWDQHSGCDPPSCHIGVGQ